MKRIVWIVILAALLLIQLVPSGRPKVTEASSADLLATVEVSDTISDLLKKSCYDCHSNYTVYPWYSYVAPVSWLVSKDVRVGRESLNFSYWDTYDVSRKAGALGDIIDEIENEEMPIAIYTLMHRDAKFNEAEKKAIIDWANQYGESLFR